MVGIRPKAPFAAVGQGPLIIAHRGGSLEAPENTVAAVRHGVAVGSDWQEVDVTLSRDEHLVVIHDDTVDRTTGGRGEVESKSIAELTALAAGKPRWSPDAQHHLAEVGAKLPDFGEAYAHERVPTLQDILAIPNSRLMIEMKKTPRPARLAQQVVQAVRGARAGEHVALGSFEFELLDAVHQLDPALPLVGIVGESGQLDRMLDLPIAVLAVDKNMLEKALRVAPAGVAVWVWTVYTPREAQGLIDGGAHGLITDIPRELLSVLRPPHVAAR
jgi:glycerophosphoryl diester phosphodiesterase